MLPRIMFVIGFITIIVALIFFEINMVSEETIKAFPDGEMKDIEKQAINVAVDYSKLMAGWGLAIIGATALITTQLRGEFGFTIWQLILIFLSFIAAFTSIYASQITPDLAFRAMISNRNLLEGDSLYFAMKVQKFSLLLSTIFLCLLAIISYFRN